MSFIDTVIFDAGGHTSNTYYFRIVDDDTGDVFDWNADALGDPAVVTWDNSAIALNEQGVTGQFPIVIPTNLPVGKRYNIVIYNQQDSIPLNSDDIESQYEMMRGSIFGF